MESPVRRRARGYVGDAYGGACYAHAWHPDRTHPMNNHCELDDITTPDGVRRRIIVNAPGYVDAGTFDENAGASDGQPALAHTE